MLKHNNRKGGGGDSGRGGGDSGRGGGIDKMRIYVSTQQSCKNIVIVIIIIIVTMMIITILMIIKYGTRKSYKFCETLRSRSKQFHSTSVIISHICRHQLWVKAQFESFSLVTEYCGFILILS